jgi:hypothetical protein
MQLLAVCFGRGSLAQVLRQRSNVSQFWLLALAPVACQVMAGKQMQRESRSRSCKETCEDHSRQLLIQPTARQHFDAVLWSVVGHCLLFVASATACRMMAHFLPHTTAYHGAYPSNHQAIFECPTHSTASQRFVEALVVLITAALTEWFRAAAQALVMYATMRLMLDCTLLAASGHIPMVRVSACLFDGCWHRR